MHFINYSIIIILLFSCKSKESINKVNPPKKNDLLKYDVDTTNGFKFSVLNNKDTLTVLIFGQNVESPYIIFNNKKLYKEFSFNENSLNNLKATSKVGTSFEYITFKNDLSVDNESVYVNCSFVKYDSIQKISYWNFTYGGGYNFINGFYEFVGQDDIKQNFTNNSIVKIPSSSFIDDELVVKFTITRNSKPDIPAIKTNSNSNVYKNTIYKILTKKW